MSPPRERLRERTGVLIVRVWVEPACGDVRARITETLDVERGQESTRVAAGVDQILAAIRDWLDRFVAAAVTGADSS